MRVKELRWWFERYCLAFSREKIDDDAIREALCMSDRRLYWYGLELRVQIV